MSTNNIAFYGEIRKKYLRIITRYQILLLNKSSENCFPTFCKWVFFRMEKPIHSKLEIAKIKKSKMVAILQIYFELLLNLKAK